MGRDTPPHMKFFSLLAATALFAAPVQADTTTAYCSYKPDISTPRTEGPCKFSQRGTSTGAMGATVYVTLQDGTKLFYDGRKQGIDFQRFTARDGIWLHRDNEGTLVVMWEKPAYEPAGY